MIAVYVFLTFVATSLALPEICRKTIEIPDLTGIQAVHIASYCMTEDIIEKVNSGPQGNVPVRPHPQGTECNYQTLANLPEDDSSDKVLFLVSCLTRAARRPGDVLPLSRDTIIQRITTKASDFVNEIDEGSICPAQDLEEVSYDELAGDFSTHVDCIVQQILIDLTNPENVGNFDFSAE